MKCEETEEGERSDGLLWDPACGYVLALAGVVLQSAGQVVGVCLPAAPTADTQRETGACQAHSL